jgi:hypothetical protein
MWVTECFCLTWPCKMVTEEPQGQRRCPRKQTEVLRWQLAAFRQLPDIPGRVLSRTTGRNARRPIRWHCERE